VAIEPRREFAQRIDVFVAIGIPHPAALPARHAEREGAVEQHAAGVAARQRRFRFGQQGGAARIAGAV